MNIRRVVGTGVVALSLSLLPLGVFAQCAMPGMSHGGHESHGSVKESPAQKKKLSKQVRAVLESEERRSELMDAVMDDAAFMREMVRRIAVHTEWRALMQERLASAPAPGARNAEEPPAEEPGAPEHVHQH